MRISGSYPTRADLASVVFIAGTRAAVAGGLVSLGLGDLEGGAVAVGFALATWLTRVRRGAVGAIGLALVGAITFAFMLTAALTNIREGSPNGHDEEQRPVLAHLHDRGAWGRYPCPGGCHPGGSFEAPPGEYEFVCAIPGHVEAGMVGTLIVEG